VLLHELPQEFGDVGVLTHSGLGVRRMLLLNVASASLVRHCMSPLAGSFLSLRTERRSSLFAVMQF
jgi:hypothetical protein